jgi:hypothetical protein
MFPSTCLSISSMVIPMMKLQMSCTVRCLCVSSAQHLPCSRDLQLPNSIHSTGKVTGLG